MDGLSGVTMASSGRWLGYAGILPAILSAGFGLEHRAPQAAVADQPGRHEACRDFFQGQRAETGKRIAKEQGRGSCFILLSPKTG
jgi:hypothetical protein